MTNKEAIIAVKEVTGMSLPWDDRHYEALQMAIKALESHWIPCSERPPEESGEYLCTLVGVHNTGLPSECGYEPPNDHGITPGWSTCEADGFKFLRDDEVLAWMSLPESYSGE